MPDFDYSRYSLCHGGIAVSYSEHDRPDWLRIVSRTPESAVVAYCPELEPLFLDIGPNGHWRLSGGGGRDLVLTRVCANFGAASALILSAQGSKPDGECYVRLDTNIAARFLYNGQAQSLIRTKLAQRLHRWGCELHGWVWNEPAAPIQRLQQCRELEVA